jgi:hypothetical protein
MTNPNTEFVVGAYAVGVALILIELVLVYRRLAKARRRAEQSTDEDDSAWNLRTRGHHE